MKINKYIITLLCPVCFLFTSCEKFLDINEPPGSPGTGSIKESVVLPTLLAQWYGETAAQMGDLKWWVLQNTQETYSYGGWALEVNYLVTYTQWNTIGGSLKNAIDVRRLAIQNGNKHYQGIAEVLMAWGWSSLTDYFGEIPYKEAFRFPEITNPKYDNQEFIYSEVEKLLESAITNLSDNSPQEAVRNADLVNQGDMSKWLKFAYGLKARLAMRLSYAPGKTKAGQAEIALNALANSLTSNADNIDFEHYNETGSIGWVYEGQRLSDFSYNGSIFIIDLLKELKDPRLEKIFDPGYNGEYFGWKTGEAVIGANIPSRVSRTKYLKADAPSILMPYTEIKFLEAEAQMFKGNMSAAQTAFEAGIRANLEYLEIAPAAIDAYIAQFTLPSDEEAAQEMIITQKYLANFMGTPEVLWDHLRTGYPKFDYPTNISNVGNRTCPRKLPHPERETQTNANCPDYIGTPNSPQNRVWWDTKVK